LNYLGLAAIAIRHPGASREGSLFFQMVPQGIATLLLVALATLATGTEMPVWQRKLLGAFSRNMSYAPDYFFIPCTQIVSQESLAEFVIPWLIPARTEPR
jgi:K+ transporter